jgi:hsp70-interacting protein
MVRSNFVEEAIKALYAVSALIRNNMDGQELFYREAGELMLQVMKVETTCGSFADFIFALWTDI